MKMGVPSVLKPPESLRLNEFRFLSQIEWFERTTGIKKKQKKRMRAPGDVIT